MGTCDCSTTTRPRDNRLPKTHTSSSVSSISIPPSFLGRFFTGSVSISSSEGLRSSSRSHTGLGGLFSRVPAYAGAGAEGAGLGSAGGSTGDGISDKGKSSMSQGGLSSCAVKAGAFSAPFPLSVVLDPEAAQASTSSTSKGAAAWEGNLSNAVKDAVAAVRKGRSKASLMRRTLTWPNPGREESRSEEAVATLAKLCGCSRSHSEF
jgi:hypothetical protein